MNLREAKEIMDCKNSATCAHQFGHVPKAQGFLDCYTQMTPLIDALESARNGLNCALEAVVLKSVPGAFKTCFDDSLILVEDALDQLKKIRGEE